MDRQEIIEALKKYRDENAQKYGIIDMGVYGSVARNQNDEASDIDVFVKTEMPNPYNLVHIKEELEELFHSKVDIIRYRAAMNPALLQRINSEGVHV